MLMAEYSYEEDLAVHCREAEARGEARGETKGKIEVYYLDMGLSVPEISKKLSIPQKNVEDILKENGFLKK